MKPNFPPYLVYAYHGFLSFGFLRLVGYVINFISVKLAFYTDRIVPRPLSIDIALTYACNLSCSFCDLPTREKEYKVKNRNGNLSREAILNLIYDAKKIGAASITFTGGEPLLHPNIIEFVELVNKNKMVSHISTSGWFFNEKMANGLVQAGLGGVTFSLHGSGPEIHDSSVGKEGSYFKVKEAVKFLVSARSSGARINIGLNAVIHKRNCHDIMKIFNIAEAWGVNQITFNPVHVFESQNISKQTEAGVGDNEIQMLKQTIDELLQRKMRSRVKTNSKYYLNHMLRFFQGKKSDLKCFAGLASITVDGFGNCFACFPHYEMKKNFGNISSKSLSNYWTSHEIASLRKEAKICKDCYWNCQTEVNLLFQ